MADKENKNSEVQQTIKRVVKRISKIFARKSILLVLAIVCVVILLSSFVWFSFYDWGTWKLNEKGRPSIYTGSVKIDPEKGIVIDKKEMIKQALMDMGYTEEEIEKMSEQQIIDKLNLSRKLNRVINSFDDFTDVELLWALSEDYAKFIKTPQELEYLLRAELITQYPYLDSIQDQAKNGIIKFYRYTGTEVNEFHNDKMTAGEKNPGQDTNTENEKQEQGNDNTTQGEGQNSEQNNEQESTQKEIDMG
ncbi:MAG: hypothetical protein HFJ55_04850, partial [Clostridia bacterium]|nr:hypothetical protein [Clostridia bacterium]